MKSSHVFVLHDYRQLHAVSHLKAQPRLSVSSTSGFDPTICADDAPHAVSSAPIDFQQPLSFPSWKTVACQNKVGRRDLLWLIMFKDDGIAQQSNCL